MVGLVDIIQLFIIVAGIIVIYYKDQGKHEVNNVSQDKEIEKMQSDCLKCRDDVDKRISNVNMRIDHVESKQTNEIRDLYEKLDKVEQRILQTINTRLDGTLKIITDLIKNQK